MLRLILIFSFISRAYPSDIVARGETAVLFAQDASLSCTLPDASGVKQVTWQRVRAQEVKTLATFSERFQNHVDEQYVGKVTFTASFNSTSIEIKNTTFEDEACYICSFKVYPTGPKRKTLCLTVKGISEMTAVVNPAPSPDKHVEVSCSATGKPSPTLIWKYEDKDLIAFRSKNFSTINKDSSTTITSNITLPLSQFHGKYVECLAQSDGIQKSDQIHIRRREDEVNNTTSRNYIITASVLIVLAVVVIGIFVICYHIRLKRATFGKKPIHAELLHVPNEDC